MTADQLRQTWLEYTTSYLNDEVTQEKLFQNSKWHAKEILKYVESRSAFYHKHLQTNGDFKSEFELLDGVPFTAKENLRNADTDVCCIPLSKIAMYYETTGTTGKPTPCPRAPIDVDTSGAYVEAAIKKIYQSTFGGMEALTAIMGPSELYAFGDTYGEVCRKLGIPFVRLWPESPRVGLEKAAGLIIKLGVKSLICSPAIALALARFYISTGVNPRETPVGQILLLGELCTPEMLSNISRIWNAHCTHGLYGSQEVHAVATGCSEGNLHLSETNYLFELLPVPGLGEDVGELCITMLVPGAKPLIRFRTGDLAAIYPSEVCQCNSQSRCVKVFGRVNELITINNRLVLPAFIESVILREVELVYGYQIDIKSRNDGDDTIELSIVAEIGERSIEKIENRIATNFGASVRLHLLNKLDPITETGAYVSWKYARIRDKRESNA